MQTPWHTLRDTCKKERAEDCLAQEYLCVVTDGETMALAHMTGEGNMTQGSFVPLSHESFAMLPAVCRAGGRRSFTVENLILDFGPGSRNATRLMQALAKALSRYLECEGKNRVWTIFEDWKALYGKVADLSATQIGSILKETGFCYPADASERLSKVLFVLHTYFALVLKLCACELVSQTRKVGYADFAQRALSLDDAGLLELLATDMEGGALFKRAGIHGFCEGRFFAWYLDVLRDNRTNSPGRDLACALRGLLHSLALYRMDDLAKARERDVLKSFYENIVPGALRKSLGEFYTPDWLVEVVLDKLKGDISGLRFLDPTCGSGSFLLAITRRLRAESALSGRELLAVIVRNVWGFDLNPLAVLTARVNYLIAIADLLAAAPEYEVEVPVFLADAIKADCESDTLSKLSVFGKEEGTLGNAFDVVVGNPPWVRWSRLPELYRERTGDMCRRYGILSGTPFHGGNEFDISGLVTYVVADRWLCLEGTLVFILPQTHFQSASSAGFRNFRLGRDLWLAPLEVEDLKDLKPFPDAANRTAILVAKKTHEKPAFPIPYHLWSRKRGYAKALPEHMAKDEVLATVTRTRNEANPILGPGSPWAILPPGEFESCKKLLGRNLWVAGRKGITCDLNGVYYVNVVGVSHDGRDGRDRALVQIETRPEAGKTDIGPARRYWVESDMLYPVIKGAGDLEMCRFAPRHELCAIVPNRAITREALAKAQADVEGANSALFGYFRAFRAQLARRSTYRKRMGAAPFYAVYNVGDYTFAPWKVVWPEQPGQGDLPVAVVGTRAIEGLPERVLVPDHKIYFAGFEEPEPAYFLCGVISCSHVQNLVRSYHVMVQVGDIFKFLRVPAYDPDNALHVLLSALTRGAHMEDDPAQRSELLEQVSALGNRILASWGPE